MAEHRSLYITQLAADLLSKPREDRDVASLARHVRAAVDEWFAAWGADRLQRIPCPWRDGSGEINAPDREPPPASLYDQLPADCELPSNENRQDIP